MRIVDPSSYTGQYNGSKHQVEVSDCYLINGRLEKCDGNYISAFRVAKVADTNVWVGPYIQNQGDMGSLRTHKIQGILNLMTPEQIAERGIDWQRQQAELRSNGI